MKKKTQDDEDQVRQNKYNINTDLIEGFLKDQDEIQDINSMRAQALAQLNKSTGKPSIIPGQAMASVSELKRELQKAKGNQNLQLSILDTIISKSAGQEKIDHILIKVDLLLEQGRIGEAESDIKTLIDIQPNSKHRLLYSRILNRKNDSILSMTWLLRSQIPYQDVAVTELYNSLISQLSKLACFQTLAIQGSNINYTIGDGTQDSSAKLRGLPELKGRVILQAVCGEFHSLILASSCPHFARNEICPSEFQKCCGGSDVIGWGDNSHGQILGNNSLDMVKKPLAIEFLVGQNVSCVSTYRYLSAAVCKTGVRIWGDTSADLNVPGKLIACGSNFVVISTEKEVLLWGNCGYEGIAMPSDLMTIGDFKAVDLAAGLAHALAVDENKDVYSFGYGEKGELGLGQGITLTKSFVKTSIRNCSKVLCHGQISAAVCGSTVFVWGLVNPEELESSNSIEWEPFSLALPTEAKTAGIGTHEVFVLGSDNNIYIWELKFSRRFKRSHEDYRTVQNIRQIALGRSMHITVQGVLIPQLTQIITCPASTKSHEPFYVELLLCDQFGPVAYPGANINVAFSKDEAKPANSAINYQLSLIDAPTTLEITPLGFGSYFLHVFVNSTQVPGPRNIKILPSEEDLEQEKAAEESKALQQLKEKEKQEKTLKAESDKKKAQQAAEEQNKKKKEETDKRAADALKSHRAKEAKEKEDKEKERKQKLELKTGGGYDLSKKKK